jgi:hypothetical protein
VEVISGCDVEVWRKKEGGWDDDDDEKDSRNALWEFKSILSIILTRISFYIPFFSICINPFPSLLVFTQSLVWLFHFFYTFSFFFKLFHVLDSISVKAVQLSSYE